MILIDGHNTLFQLHDPDGEGFLKAQQQLTHEVLRWTQKKKSQKCILVFDGSGGGAPEGREEQLSSNLRVVYSGTLTADEWIIAWIETHKGVLVQLVTNDKRLYEKVNYKNVKRSPPNEWKREVTRVPHSEKHPKNHGSSPGKKEFGSTAYWLKEFGES
ncbi:MAG: NYN domain-containing protein [Planctomycetes bacterium]|nr:NYN domain-containing protein [Planctomycetota bacterium]